VFFVQAGLLGGLAAGSAVEVCSSEGGVPCWAQGYLIRRIGPTATTASIELLGDQGQVHYVGTECFPSWACGVPHLWLCENCTHALQAGASTVRALSAPCL